MEEVIRVKGVGLRDPPQKPIIVFHLIVEPVVGREFRKAAIPYMVIGEQAVLLYGEPHLTKDIDITVGIGARD